MIVDDWSLGRVVAWSERNSRPVRAKKRGGYRYVRHARLDDLGRERQKLNRTLVDVEPLEVEHAVSIGNRHAS